MYKMGPWLFRTHNPERKENTSSTMRNMVAVLEGLQEVYIKSYRNPEEKASCCLLK